VRSTVIDDQTPFVPLVVPRFRASSPSSRPSRSKSATTVHRLWQSRRGAADAEQRSASSTGCEPSSPKPALAKAGGDKALSATAGFRRYLKTVSAEHFAVDEKRSPKTRALTALCAAHQHQAHPLQVCCAIATYCGRAVVPPAKAVLAHSPNLPQQRHGDSRPRVLLLPCPVLARNSRIASTGTTSQPNGTTSCAISTGCRKSELEQDGKRFCCATRPPASPGKALRAVGVAPAAQPSGIPLTTPQPAA